MCPVVNVAVVHLDAKVPEVAGILGVRLLGGRMFECVGAATLKDDNQM